MKNEFNVELHKLQERIFANDPTVWNEISASDSKSESAQDKAPVKLRAWPKDKKSEPYEL